MTKIILLVKISFIVLSQASISLPHISRFYWPPSSNGPVASDENTNKLLEKVVVVVVVAAVVVLIYKGNFNGTLIMKLLQHVY